MATEKLRSSSQLLQLPADCFHWQSQIRNTTTSTFPLTLPRRKSTKLKDLQNVNYHLLYNLPNIKLVKNTDILEHDHSFGYNRFQLRIDSKGYSISVFITLLIKVSHCRQNKDYSSSYWRDFLRGQHLRLQVRKPLVALSVFASKMIQSRLPA